MILSSGYVSNAAVNMSVQVSVRGSAFNSVEYTHVLSSTDLLSFVSSLSPPSTLCFFGNFLTNA